MTCQKSEHLQLFLQGVGQIDEKHPTIYSTGLVLKQDLGAVIYKGFNFDAARRGPVAIKKFLKPVVNKQINK